ncbi:glycosyltransferase family 2 protein [Erythrobacter sp. NFXS35]|uniref:glycosyltransferase family 2 protein n=1 Tax=Erythrobacter sp. NFXS35 TaxID=2818436 RepID=UPI0032DEB305
MQGIPEISVVSSWYNRSHDLENSVESVLGQVGPTLEYIIVDDASDEDATIVGLEQFAQSDPRVRLLRNDRNLGFTRSMIRAVGEARGAYVAVHDAGDISLPGRLAAQVDFFERHPEHVMCGTRVRNHDLRSGVSDVLPTNVDSPFKGIEGQIFTHGEVMFRREAYEQVGGYRDLFYYSQDTDLWRRLGEIGKLGHLDEVLYERRIFEEGVEGNVRKLVAQAIFGNLARISAEARRAGQPDPIERYHALALLQQDDAERFRDRAYDSFRHGFRHDQDALGDAIAQVPAGLLSTKVLAAYLLLRIGRKLGFKHFPK